LIVFLSAKGSESFDLYDWIAGKEDKDFLLKRSVSLKNFQSLFPELLDEILPRCNEDRTVWSFVAARLLLLNNYLKHVTPEEDKILINYQSLFLSFVKEGVKSEIYREELLEKITEEVDLEEISLILDYRNDLLFSYSALKIFYERYAVEVGGKFECPQWAFLLIAICASLREKSGRRVKFIEEGYYLLSHRLISAATPILLNLRRRKGNLASCFILAVEDSIEDIFYSFSKVATISKNAGGVGVYLGKIRARGSFIKETPNSASGVISFIKVLNDIALAVNQQGKRAGAITVAIDVWHREIFGLLEIQRENGDPRTKAFDLFPQIVLYDLYMQRVESGESWTLFDPEEVRRVTGSCLCDYYGREFDRFYSELERNPSLTLKKEISARELFKRIIQTQIETGLPYLFFKDTVNQFNNNSHAGMIYCGNLCQESFSNFSYSEIVSEEIEEEETFQNRIKSDAPIYFNQRVRTGDFHVCNLTSLNLTSIAEQLLKGNNLILERAVKFTINFLDNMMDISDYPVKEAYVHCMKYRVIGLGYLGLHDYLALNEKHYDSEEGITMVKELSEKIALYAIGESIRLAEERGRYPAYYGSTWSREIIFGRQKEEFLSSPHREEWIKIFERLNNSGIRNSQLISIAPNTSTSIFQDSTSSVLPTWSKFHFDKNSKGVLPIFPRFIEEKKNFYKENKMIDQTKVVEMISEIQKWVDQGISMELLFNLNHSSVDAKSIFDTLLYAWKKNCKTVYYMRFIQKGLEAKAGIEKDNSSNKIVCEGCES